MCTIIYMISSTFRDFATFFLSARFGYQSPVVFTVNVIVPLFAFLDRDRSFGLQSANLTDPSLPSLQHCFRAIVIGSMHATLIRL